MTMLVVMTPELAEALERLAVAEVEARRHAIASNEARAEMIRAENEHHLAMRDLRDKLVAALSGTDEAMDASSC